MTKTAIVVGGGVVGSACALRLQQRGIAVMLIDDAPATPRASWGNAGHIAAEQAEPLASRAMIASAPRRLFLRGGPVALPPRDIDRWLPFGMRLWRASAPARFARGHAALRALLADAMPAWRRLAIYFGDPALVRTEGHLIVWENPATAAAGRAAWARADTGSTTFRAADDDDLAALAEFTRATVAGAIRFTGSGQIADLTRLAAAQAAAFARVGGVRRTARATLRAEGATVVDVDGELLRADTVVVAAGVASAALLAPLGLRVPMIAERGYHIEGEAAGPMLPPVVFEDRSLVVTRFGDRLRAASFIEFGRADRAPDPRKWARLERHAAELGLPFAGPRMPWQGSRPTLPDYLPVIGRGPGNLVCAFGHNHLGLTLAPVTAERVAALVVDGAPVDAAFALERF